MSKRGPGRPKGLKPGERDKAKQELIKKLGLEDVPSVNTISTAKLEKKVQDIEDGIEMGETLTGPVPEGTLYIPDEVEDPFEGLTERQKLIARMRLRGMSQKSIANIFSISQPAVHKELQKIKEWQIKKGTSVDEAEIVGATTTLYEEIEHRAWDLFYDGETDITGKAKMLAIVMSAREKNNKLLLELGLLKKATQKIDHSHSIKETTFISEWKDKRAKKQLGDEIIISGLPKLPEPIPEEEYIEAEIIEIERKKLDDDLSTETEIELDEEEDA